MKRTRLLLFKKAASNIIGCNVEITITTSLPNNLRGCCVAEKDGLHILINAKWAKDEYSIAQTIAHELAHVDHPREHSEAFRARMEDILCQLKKYFNI